MRYSPSDKTEIIQLAEQSPLPVRRTLDKLGIPRSSFYRWYDRYQRGGPEALADRPSRPDRVWNRIPEAIRKQIVDLALDQPELSPRELAVRFTDEAKYFVSEASVYRLLKAHDLIASPAYIVIKASEEFRDKTTAPKAAIDRYFDERNCHFREHPHRAGKKIWGKERVPPEFAAGNNCKDPRYQ